MLVARSLLIAIGLLTIGCAGNVTYYHKTVAGLDLAIQPEELRIHLVAGYSRKLEADIPEVQNATGDKDEGEAQSVLSCSSIAIRFFDLEVKDRLATGEAAKSYAERYQKGSRAFQCATPRRRNR